METKKWYTSKTLWFAVLYGVVNLAGLAGFGDYQPSTDVQQIVGLLVAATFMGLRFISNKKVAL